MFFKLSDKNKKSDNGEKKVYEILVSVRDEISSDPDQDKKSSMKKGYVIGVYNEGQKWSDTERISYLILKISLTSGQKEDLVSPIEKEIDLDELSEEERKILEERGEKSKTEVMGARKYKIDLEEVGFNDPSSLLKGQPFQDNVFDWSVVEKIK